MTTRATIETRPELKEFSVPKVYLQISFNEIAFNFHSSQLEQVSVRELEFCGNVEWVVREC